MSDALISPKLGLRLRPPVPGDAPALAAIAGDLEVSRWLPPVPHPYAETDALALIAGVTQSRAAGARDAGYVIEDGEGVAGFVGLRPEVVAWLAPRCWNKGYTTDAIRAVLARHFSAPQAPTVWSSYLEGHPASSHLLMRLGFGHRAGSTREVLVRSTGERRLCHNMPLTPEQWHMLNPWQFETERLHLRPLTTYDAADLARIGGDPKVAPMIFAATVPWPEAEAARFAERNRWRGRLGFRLGIERDGRLIGTVGLFPPRGAAPPAMAYFLDPAHWGAGLATEALRAFLPAAMARFQLGAIAAEVFHDNPASAHLLGKLGFTQTGTGLGRSAARVEPARVTLYRVTTDSLKA